MNTTYEKLRSELERLSPATDDARNLQWLAPELAVGVNVTGDFEIFLIGEEIVASSALLRRHLQHGEWQPSGGGKIFFASRIVLPSAPHFASVAALISIELLRAGIAGSGNPQAAFSDVEPIIEMAIRRGALPENVIIGLIGELIVLRQSLLVCEDDDLRQGELLDSWQGWQDGGRDFRIGNNSIEVKTTQAASSIHEFSGLHQLEPQQLPDGSFEQMHILSVGLASSTAIGESLPFVVDGILDMIGKTRHSDSSALQDLFLRNVEAYGSANGSGYAHRSMSDWSVYCTKYTHTFVPRLYRVDDPHMRLLRREELARTFVQPSSVSFTLHLPETVSAFNPAASWQEALSYLIDLR